MQWNHCFLLIISNAITVLKDARGGGIPKVAIVVTDGQSQDSVAERAQQLRDAHVMMYAIGVTNLVNVHQLHQVITDTSSIV